MLNVCSEWLPLCTYTFHDKMLSFQTSVLRKTDQEFWAGHHWHGREPSPPAQEYKREIRQDFSKQSDKLYVDYHRFTYGKSNQIHHYFAKLFSKSATHYLCFQLQTTKSNFSTKGSIIHIIYLSCRSRKTITYPLWCFMGREGCVANKSQAYTLMHIRLNETYQKYIPI